MSFIQSLKQYSAICLLGPTAAGKTQLALEMARVLPVEIISVDSVMVYRGMDIGTGKPSLAERALVPHHLIDIRDPMNAYSAAEFAKDAFDCLKEIQNRGRIPLLVGGTLLYFKALWEGLSLLPSANPEIRSRLFQEGNELGWEVLYHRLQRIDPESAVRIHPHDKQRIQRALEVYEISGKPMSLLLTKSELLTKPEKTVPKSKIDETKIDKTNKIDRPHYLNCYESNDFNAIHPVITLAMMPSERSILHQKIEKRFNEMLESGFVDEVKKLFYRGDLSADLPAMRAVGYRQVWGYLAGEYGYDEMVQKAIAATRQLAKRQITWLRSLTDIHWLPQDTDIFSQNLTNQIV